MIECPLPVDPATEDERPIVIPPVPRTESEREYLKMAIKYSEGMRDWWLVKETARMKKELDD